jgi:hypothetical protein
MTDTKKQETLTPKTFHNKLLESFKKVNLKIDEEALPSADIKNSVQSICNEIIAGIERKNRQIKIERKFMFCDIEPLITELNKFWKSRVTLHFVVNLDYKVGSHRSYLIEVIDNDGKIIESALGTVKRDHYGEGVVEVTAFTFDAGEYCHKQLYGNELFETQTQSSEE